MDAANEFLRAFLATLQRLVRDGADGARERVFATVTVVKTKLPDSPPVGNDNCVAYRCRRLQIPPQRHRCHYVRAKVSVHEHEDGGLAVFHGTLRLVRYDAAGRRLDKAGAAA